MTNIAIEDKIWASLVAQMVKNMPAMQEAQVRPPGQGYSLEKWQPTPVFLPGEFHGQRSLPGYSPWVSKSQTQLSDYHFHFHNLKLSWEG